ncbi:hypothetical protein EMIHUDRAFT_438942 [Emiliania huxleyi CCMP1516]|uniref:GOLD domain-containing protein n=2 Tax=Emiliania huxleyi TaxID=2903 RepID=A0A0D3I2U8_EMIH1|nr:hypothetical protein EMIHUDRAFT_438942 [Emiliania huxleyi CCMP1516]EOD05583.1 hypothetical protein EMIHUDRAFT_438942 [Emiliania huxleyi CCMP1516]|eukprot:XP_005758012.1 hypothetical protein EMIHUDRAFT_438942 [Emiliania huxleyi CCMP1516]
MFSRVRSPTRRAGDKASPRGTVATTTAVSVEDAFVIGALHRGQIGPTYKTAGRKIPAGSTCEMSFELDCASVMAWSWEERSGGDVVFKAVLPGLDRDFEEELSRAAGPGVAAEGAVLSAHTSGVLRVPAGSVMLTWSNVSGWSERTVSYRVMSCSRDALEMERERMAAEAARAARAAEEEAALARKQLLLSKAEMQPRCSRDAAEMQPRCSRDAAEMQPRCSRDSRKPLASSVASSFAALLQERAAVEQAEAQEALAACDRAEAEAEAAAAAAAAATDEEREDLEAAAAAAARRSEEARRVARKEVAEAVAADKAAIAAGAATTGQRSK